MDASGKPILLQDEAHREVLARLSAVRLDDIREMTLAKKDLWLVTDDNMALKFERDRLPNLF